MIARLPGFTLIELMVALAIFGLLLMLAGPQLGIFMANSQIRNAAEAMLNGIQQAQNIAVNRNASSAPVCLIVDPTTGSGGWQIVQATGDCDAATVPDPAPVNPAKVYTLQDASPKVSVGVVPALAVGKLTFDGFGRIIANADGSASLTCIKITHPLSGTRRLNVAITNAGLTVGTKLCDPNPDLPAGDPQTCPAGCN